MFMSAMIQGGKLGVCYYEQNSGKLHCTEDTPFQRSNTEVLAQTLMEVNPNVLIIQGKNKSTVAPIVDHCNREGCAIELRTAPSRECDLELARRRILNIQLPGLPE